MPEPLDMLLPLLREMRAENVSLHNATAQRLEVLERRMASLATADGSFRQALSADSLLSRLVTGEFEQRIEALERKVHDLESHR